MLTIQSIYLLYLLKWAQITEDDVCCIMSDSLHVGRADDKCMRVMFRKKDRRKIHFLSKSIDSVLIFLEEQKYIDLHKQLSDDGKCLYICKVRHKGWHTYQLFISKLCFFLFRSIAVPIAVSLLTALATLYFFPKD